MPPIIIKNLQVDRKKISVAETLTGPSIGTTENLPLKLVENIMEVHNEANPESVSRFAKLFLSSCNGDAFISDILVPKEAELNLQDPKQLMTAFYKHSFLQNEEASSFVAYSLDGKLVGFALLGNFSNGFPQCSISNLSLSLKASSAMSKFIVSDLTDECKKQGLEPSLVANSFLSKAYAAYGFKPSVEHPSIAGCTLYKYATTLR